MILQTSWLAHLRKINTADQANKNFGALVNGTAVEKPKNDKINAIAEDPDSIVVVADNNHRVKLVHNCKKIGGTRNNASVTVGGLVGQGARAFPVVLDIDAATANNTVTIPSLKKIMHCRTTLELDLLSVGAEDQTKGNGEETVADVTTPSLTMSTPRRASARICKRSAQTDEAADEATDKTIEETNNPNDKDLEYKESLLKIPAPFLAFTAFASNSTNPLNIIIATRNAAVEFSETHMDAKDFEDIRPSVESLIKWLFAVHMGLISETRLAMEPDNDKLAKYLDERHRLCILSPHNSTIHHATNIQGTSDSVLLQLIHATNRNNEICKETDRVRLKEYEWKKKTDEVKKDRTKDLDPSVQRMIENASATEKDKSGDLCPDFIALFNSKPHGGFDIKLHQLFENDGMKEVVFPEGVATNLWVGLFKRTHKSAPGAFSPFSFSKIKPLSSSDDKDRSLLIDIFSVQKGGLMRNLDNVKASAKNDGLGPTRLSFPSFPT
jgi:hypothetical protein